MTLELADVAVVFATSFAGGVLGGFIGVWLGWTMMFVEARRRGRMFHER